MTIFRYALPTHPSESCMPADPSARRSRLDQCGGTRLQLLPALYGRGSPARRSLLPGRRTARHPLVSRPQQHPTIVLQLLDGALAHNRTQRKRYMRTLVFSTPLPRPTMHLACPDPETRQKGQRHLETQLTTSWRQGLGGFHSAGMLALHSHACPAFPLFVKKMCMFP